MERRSLKPPQKSSNHGPFSIGKYMTARARPDLATLIEVSKAGDGSDRYGAEGITLSYRVPRY